MGAWDYLKGPLSEIAREVGCKDSRIRYAGRETSAAPATGLLEDHQTEQARLIDEALRVGIEPMGRLEQRKALSRERSRG